MFANISISAKIHFLPIQTANKQYFIKQVLLLKVVNFIAISMPYRGYITINVIYSYITIWYFGHCIYLTTKHTKYIKKHTKQASVYLEVALCVFWF